MTDIEKDEKTPLLEKPSTDDSSTTSFVSPRSWAKFTKSIKAARQLACCGAFRYNVPFGENVELAFRGAFFAMPIAFPFFVPWDALGLPNPTHSTEEHGTYFSSTAVVIYVFTLYKTLGETICFAVAGMLGTFLAVFNIWIMFGIMPMGVHPESSVWISVIGWIWGMLFTLIVLFLNFDILAKMFALSWHMYFWMTFLNPASHAFTHSFGMRLDGPAFKALTMSALGCAVAILAACLPYPLLALNKARTSSRELAAVLRDSWTTAVHCYAGQRRSLLLEDKLKQDMGRLDKDVLLLVSHIDNAWWECFGFGRAQKTRVNLRELERILKESYNRLGTLMYSCKMESYGPRHQQMMNTFKPKLDAVCTTAGELFELATALAGQGHLSEGDIKTITATQTATHQAVEDLTKLFKQVQIGEVDGHNVDEFSFCLNVCAYGTLALDFATILIDNNNKIIRERPTMIGIFDCSVITGSWNLAWVFRNGLSIILSFVVGYFGYSAMIKHHNSAPAETVSLLLSTFVGSQINKNMGRVQGVVLGCVFGQMVYALFAWCAWWGYVVICLSVILWLISTLFVYYNSSEFGYIGCLMAAFGTKYMLQGCSNEQFLPTNTYYTIINTVVGITIMTFCDMTITQTPTSHLASNALMDAWDMYAKAVNDLFDPSVEQVRFHHGLLLGKLAEATRLGDEAAKEPRFYRTPWRARLFEHAVKAMFLIRMYLCVMECGAAKNGRDGNKKSYTVTRIENMKAFDEVKKDISTKIAQIRMLFSIFTYERDGDPFESMDMASLTASRHTEKKHIDELLKEVSSSLSSEEILHSNRNAKVETLEDVMVCELSTIVNAIDGQLDEISHLKHQILCSVN